MNTEPSQIPIDRDAPATRVAALRDSGGWRADPVRFRYLQALSARMAGQPDAVHRLLEQKLQAALDRFPEPGPSPAAAPARIDTRCVPLMELNQYVRSVTTARQSSPGEAAPDELASARRFRRSWESGRTLDRLEQALARTPANAGPLNSHALVLRSLEALRDLSPDYLRRLLVQVESLQWLEKAREKYPREQAKGAAPARRGRRRK
jgi:hypothetical protein